jgi:hypothetical protein
MFSDTFQPLVERGDFQVRAVILRANNEMILVIVIANTITKSYLEILD